MFGESSSITILSVSIMKTTTTTTKNCCHNINSVNLTHFDRLNWESDINVLY